MEKQCILSLSKEGLQEALKQLSQPAFRAGQIFTWLHQKRVQTFVEMTNIPKSLMEQLEENFYIATPTIQKKQVSKDGTVKYLFTLQDGHAIETVVMRYRHGNSICVSTQVGCRMGCKFCASTIGGLQRNLSTGEMLGQVYAATADLAEMMDSLVLMGIGEPLDNFDNVVAFLNAIASPEGYGLSRRSISLSTCGLVPGIDRLAGEKLGLTLSISLHAPFNEMRSGMMPVNDAYNIEELLAACRRYQKETGRRVSFEYTLVGGVNDTKECALALAAHVRTLTAAHVNLIPLNTVEETGLVSSNNEKVQAFKTILEENGVETTVRRRLGEDIAAACGQLRRESATQSRE